MFHGCRVPKTRLLKKLSDGEARPALTVNWVKPLNSLRATALKQRRKELINNMENENNTNQAAGTGAVDNNATATETGAEMVTMSKVDYDKAIQSAEDRVRTKAAKEYKALEAKLPVEKTQAEKDLEARMAEIEAKQAEVDAKDKAVALKSALQDAGIDIALADYLKTDIDVKALSEAVTAISNAKRAANGYVPPSGHDNNKGVTLDEWTKMDWDKKVAIRESNPELAKIFTGRFNT